MQNSTGQLVLQARELIRRAEAEGRPLTGQEQTEFDGLLDRAAGRKGAEHTRREVDNLSRELGPTPTGTSGSGLSFNAPSVQGPGDAFIQSQGYKSIVDPQSRGQSWSTGPVEVPLRTKGTVLTSPGTALTPAQYQPGVVQTLFEPLGVGDLFGTSSTNASQVRYVNETAATNAAAGVAEAGTKPESTLVFGEVVEPIKKIATVIQVSDEMLEDGPSMSSYLNSRLSLFVKLEEERQLLRGTGTNELVGMFARSVGTYTRGTSDNNAVALLKAAAGVRGSSFLEPDAVVMHPNQWLSTRLLADTAGQFLGGGPFQGQYGSGAQVPASQFTGAPIWGMRVAVSNIVGPGTALLGSFSQGAHIWRRTGVTVEASNSHGSLFVQNLVAIRAEERLGLGLFRPSAFVQVVNLA